VVTLDTPRYNATSDLRGVRTVLPPAPTRVFALDLQDLALSFNLDRPVVNCKNYASCVQRVRDGEGRYVDPVPRGRQVRARSRSETPIPMKMTLAVQAAISGGRRSARASASAAKWTTR